MSNLELWLNMTPQAQELVRELWADFAQALDSAAARAAKEE